MSWIVLYSFGAWGPTKGAERVWGTHSVEMKPSRIKCEIAGNSQRRSILGVFFSVFGGCLEPGLMGDVNALEKMIEHFVFVYIKTIKNLNQKNPFKSA